MQFEICNSVYAHSQAAIKAFNQGVERFNAKAFGEAIPFFDEAISHDSEFADAFYARGACRHYLKGLDGALMDLNDALRFKPDLLDARSLRGAVYYESDRWDQALEDFNYVLERHPTDAQSLLGRGVVYLKREDVTHAEKDFRSFLKAHPDDPLAPRLRKLIASLSGGPAEETATPRQGEAHHDAGSPRRPSAEAKEMADALMLTAHGLSDEFSRKVLRGERAEAIGDINTVHSPRRQPSQGEGVQIVEPR